MFKHIATITALLIPGIMLAQGNATDAKTLLTFLGELVNGTIIPLFILGALAFTIYSVVDFIAAREDSQTKEEKKQRIFWGIIGLFVIISIWSLVGIVGNTFNIFAGGTLEAR